MSKIKKFLLSNPFHIGPYGTKKHSPFEKIINLKAANNNANDINPSNIILDCTKELPEVEFEIKPDIRHNDGVHFDTCLSMVEGTIKSLNSLPSDFESLVIIGGDHSISIGTGASLSQKYDLKKVGLIYVDTHGDCNTPETSISKSITGYPLAVLNGMGHKDMLKYFNGNFIEKIVHIGVRDLDPTEFVNFTKLNALSFNIFDLELMGVKSILEKSLEYLKDCDFIWLSIDIDVLDPVYFKYDETDEPAPAGMTPRELITLIKVVSDSGKLKITEIVQINFLEIATPIIWLASRMVELSLGIGSFRYGL
jgi:arginase